MTARVFPIRRTCSSAPPNEDASLLVEHQLQWIIALALSATNFLACCNSGRCEFVL